MANGIGEGRDRRPGLPGRDGRGRGSRQALLTVAVAAIVLAAALMGAVLVESLVLVNSGCPCGACAERGRALIVPSTRLAARWACPESQLPADGQ